MTAAEDLLRSRGARVTAARVGVLDVLHAAGRALSHAEVESELARRQPADRVTVYRVLDWLVREGLAHRVPGDDRAWRFNAMPEGHAGDHAHFHCDTCGRTICLASAPSGRLVRLPKGFLRRHVELTIHGVCDGCGPPPGRASGRLRAAARQAAR